MVGEQVGAAYARIGLDAKELDSGMSSAKGRFGSFADDIEGRAGRMGSAIGNAIKVGLVAGVAAIGASLVGGTKAFADYEQGLASVSKTTGLAGDDLKALGDDLRSLATSGPVTVAQLERIAGAAGSLGIGASKMASGDLAGARSEITEFTKVMSDMSVAFEMDAEQVATSMADIGNVYKVPTSGLKELGSQINVLENSMSATAPQIIDFMGAFGGTASMFGESASSTAAFGATLSQLGVKGTEASTQLRSGILQLTQASNVSEAKIKAFAEASNISIEEATAMFADGQENIVKMAQLMGVSVDELKDGLNKDLYGTLIKAGRAFKGIEGDTKKAAEAQKIFGAYGYSALIKLGDGAEIYADALQKVQVSGNELTQEASVMSNTLSGQWQRMKNGINDVGISIGEVTSGPLKKFMAFLNDSAIPAAKGFIEALAKGDWSKVNEAFSKGMDFIKDKIAAVGDYIKGLPWGEWFDSAITTVTKHFENLPSTIKPALNKLADMFGAGTGVDWAGAASKLITLLGTYIQSYIKSLLEIGDWIYDKLSAWVTGGGPKKLGESIVDTIAGGIKKWLDSDVSIWDSLKKVWGIAGDWWDMGVAIIKGIGSGILGKVNDYLGPARNQFLDFVQIVADAFFELGKTLTTAITGALKDIAPMLDSFVTTLGRTIPGLASALGGSSSGGSSPSALVGKGTAAGAPAPTTSEGGKQSWNVNGYSITKSGTSKYIAHYKDGSYMGSYDSYQAAVQAIGRVELGAGESYSGGVSAAWSSGGGSWNKPQSPSSGWVGRGGVKTTSAYDQGVASGLIDTSLESKKAAQAFGSAYGVPVATDGPSEEQEKAWAKGYSNAADLALEGTDKTFKYTGFADAINGLTSTVNSAQGTTKTYLDGLRWKATVDKTWISDALAIKGKSNVLLNGISETTGALGNFPPALTAASSEMARDIAGASSDLAASTKAAAKIASDVLIGGSNTAAMAIQLGGQVSANFTSMAGQAVKIGLDATGREIAIIGQVAQKQWTDGGNQLYSKIQASGDSLGNTLANGAVQTEASSSAARENMRQGGEASMTGGIKAGQAMATGADGITGATTGLSGALGAFAGTIGGIVGAVSGKAFSQIFGGGAGGGGSQSVGSIGSAVQTFNDCMFEGFTDSCTNMNINALKYTSPGGVVQYVNPMNNEAVRTLGGSGGASSGGGSSGYKLPAGLMARGGNPSKPTLALIAERGEEMVLPNDITVGLKSMIASGGAGGQKIIVEPAPIYLDGRKIADILMTAVLAKARAKGFGQH